MYLFVYKGDNTLFYLFENKKNLKTNSKNVT